MIGTVCWFGTRDCAGLPDASVGRRENARAFSKRARRARRDKPVAYELVSGIGTGNGVTLLPELSVILATPSFSTSSMRITACMGMKLR